MTESERHIEYKDKVTTILTDLEYRGMNIENIDQEGNLEPYKTVKVYSKLGLRQIEEQYGTEISINKKKEMVFYVCNSPYNVYKDDIVINKNVTYELPKIKYSIIQTENGSNKFIIALRKPKDYNRFLRDYEIFIRTEEERSSNRDKPKFDVFCKYKGTKFAFEIGKSWTDHDNYRVLHLDYNFLNNNSYLTIKKRIKKFLIKHTKVT